MKLAPSPAVSGIPLVTLDEFQEIDVTIDGADEIDPQLPAHQGRRSGISARKDCCLRFTPAGHHRRLEQACANLGKAPVPVEVIPFAQALVAKEISALGAKVSVRQDSSGKAWITDEGHHILDCHFGRIPDPPGLALQLEQIPGVVEHGLFIHMAKIALVAGESGVQELQAQR